MKRCGGLEVVLLLLLLTFGVPTPGTAQGQPLVGERIRVLTVDGDSYAGTLSAVSSEGMVIAGGREGRALRMSEIAYLERSTDRYRRFGRNFVVSVLATGMTTGTIAAASWSRCVSNEFLGCFMASESRSEEFGLGFVAGGVVIGVPLGVILGVALRYDRWEAIPLTGTEGAVVTISPVLDGGLGLAASIAF